MGLIDRNVIVRNAFEGIDYSLADIAVKDQQSATQAEQQNEMDAVSKIIGSGLDQPLPQGGNYQLRLQTLQNTVQQAMQTNPATQKILRDNPEILKVLQKRMQYFQNQLQQLENAQIGRMLSTQTFTKQAPVVQEVGGMSSYSQMSR
jgi:hypothetical protein